MDLLNALSIPRANALYLRRTLVADCLASDAVGDCVYITGPLVGGRYQVSKADPTDQSKMPAFAVIISKQTATQCIIQFVGALPPTYAGLVVGKTVFLSALGTFSSFPPVPDVGAYAFVQPMGVCADTGKVLLFPSFALTKLIG